MEQTIQEKVVSNGTTITLDSTLIVSPRNPVSFPGLLHNLGPSLRMTYGRSGEFSVMQHQQKLGNHVSYQKGFVEMVAKAYSTHEPIVVAPHDLWYVVLSEIASVIKKNETTCRSLFTKSEEKITIEVPAENLYELPLATIMERLRELSPVDLDIFVPELTTSTPDAVTAMYAGVCDALQNYYDYMTYMCGLPMVRVTGTKTDWQNLIFACQKISDIFKSVNLPSVSTWLGRCEDIFSMISITLDNPESQESIDFWKSIYRKKNVGSGQQMVISGWIVDLFYEKRALAKLENYTTNMSVVPFTAKGVGGSGEVALISVHGPFEVHRTNDGFLETVYNNIVFKHEKA
jgi:hypothetical protein